MRFWSVEFSNRNEQQSQYWYACKHTWRQYTRFERRNQWNRNKWCRGQSGPE
jgi:hypothetical protein